ncbi:Glycosyltransferase, catalytic subunit of cellulose synthase and poly-beta-1,6-N-acetylglucosamine synthase [Enhydrobacter aerosaccus]|uniref:Glycosyltransferase, catalytic subunit of cellulose synthase and poly-beta-1,6-N-acetylglucosamine synthase n=1 Tax=Enhydrobacter aerosaccus TaxID=225324 RepID=A0A1T4S0J7_9HYPH|nr:glycosyltransferase family 2 protein [Enhydrobacter aerosaccus]SKA21458.1 Glycosyltransferase, catalytic subunit of cellulose synthase and poly-beta-1,6-N-acetylglucosamine synthase [Enhydrobacter aerosaccus]
MLTIIDLVVLLCLAAQFAIAAYFFYLLYWLADDSAATSPPPALPDDLPRVLVQIPVYNEPMVVERAVRAAAALDWPRDRLKIQLLDDSTDLTSDMAHHAISRLQREGIDAEHIRRRNRTGFKAGALAAGMALCDAPYVAVFDADFVPARDWLKRAMAALLAAPKAAFVQTRIEWGNGGRNWLTRAQRLMQDAHFAVEQDVRARRGVPFQFNGTGGIWRRAAIDDAGGWSHDTLSEDLDLVLRTHLKGWGGVFLMEPHVVGELPQRLGDFGAQQSRWSKGFVQVARKLLPQVWNADWSGEAKFTTTIALGQQLIFPALVVGVVGLILSVMGHGRLLPIFGALLWMWLIAMLVVLLGMTWSGYHRLKRGGIAGYLATAATVPALIVYLAVANAGAILSAGMGRKTEFKRTPKTGV